MNQTMQAILQRRSIRKFVVDIQLSQEQLDTIMQAALYAPSAMNTQGWHFTVIQNQNLIHWMNQEIKNELPEESRVRMIARCGENFNVFYGAPTVILVAGRKGDKWSECNCGMAAQNICLAAHSLGLASCVIGMAKVLFLGEKAAVYQKEFGILEPYEGLYAIAVGTAGIEAEAPLREPDRVHYIR